MSWYWYRHGHSQHTGIITRKIIGADGRMFGVIFEGSKMKSPFKVDDDIRINVENSCNYWTTWFWTSYTTTSILYPKVYIQRKKNIPSYSHSMKLTIVCLGLPTYQINGIAPRNLSRQKKMAAPSLRHIYMKMENCIQRNKNCCL